MFHDLCLSQDLCCIQSRQSVGKVECCSLEQNTIDTTPRHYTRNALDTHGDSGFTGENWCILWYTGELCEVSLFLPSYEYINRIPVTGCGSVWSCKETGLDFLLIANQLLYFGKQLPQSLFNPNQICAFGIKLNDNPFYMSCELGMDCGDVFIPFDTTRDCGAF